MSLIGATTLGWDDQSKRGVVLWKAPRNIKYGDNIVVREDEFAVFYRDGKAIAYIDRPDRYALTSINAPIIGGLVKLLSGIVQWAEVFYVQRNPFDGKFGSKQPYQFRDRDFGMVNLRVFGEFRYKVKDCSIFINQFVGTMNYHTAEEVEGRIREQMVLLVYDALGHMKEKGMGVADLSTNLTTIEQVVIEKSRNHFDLYGLEIQKISSLYVSIPEEVQKAVDAKSSMTVLGTDYMGYQTGQAMRDAARNTSGGGALAGAGVGMGAGIGMGAAMGNSMAGGGGGRGGTEIKVKCSKCGALMDQNAKFCPSCGSAQMQGVPCPSCGAVVPSDAAFCPKCGAKMGAPSSGKKCPTCGKDIATDAKFCPACGAKIP
jgi:membrane protease subunit (stomatin/prohibitin family)